MIDVTALGTCRAKYPDQEPESDQPATHSGSPSDRRDLRRNPCLIHCYMNQTAIYKNGTLDKAAAVTVLGKSLDESMKTVLSAAVDSCFTIQEGWSNIRTNIAVDNKQPQCDLSVGLIAHCIEMEMYKNCPADKMVTSDSCKSLATYMDKCMFDKKT